MIVFIKNLEKEKTINHWTSKKNIKEFGELS